MERQSQEPTHHAVTDNAMMVPKDLALPNFDAVFMQVRVYDYSISRRGELYTNKIKNNQESDSQDPIQALVRSLFIFEIFSPIV